MLGAPQVETYIIKQEKEHMHSAEALSPTLKTATRLIDAARAVGCQFSKHKGVRVINIKGNNLGRFEKELTR